MKTRRALVTKPISDKTALPAFIRHVNQQLQRISEATPVLQTDIYPLLAWEDKTAVVDTSYPYFNVLRYGADATGVLDATAAAQAAAAAIDDTGAELYFPKGTYLITDTIDVVAFWGLGITDAASVHVVMDPGAIILFQPAAANTPLFRVNNLTGQEAQVIFRGGQIDGSGATQRNCHAFEIHSGNVTYYDGAVRNFVDSAAVRLVFDLAVPPICMNIVNLKAKFCQWGVFNDANAAQLSVTNSRLEGCFRHGLFSNDGSKTVNIGNTIEDNGHRGFTNIGVWNPLPVISGTDIAATATGYTSGSNAFADLREGDTIVVAGFATGGFNGAKVITACTPGAITCLGSGVEAAGLPITITQEYQPQVAYINRGEMEHRGNYHESLAAQPHNEIVVAGTNFSAGPIVIAGTRFVNYLPRCIDIGPFGVVENVTIGDGNFFVMNSGTTAGTAVRIGAFVRGYKIGNSGWSDTFTDGATWDPATVYVIGQFARLSGRTYTCVLGHVNQRPPNATYWSMYPRRYDVHASAIGTTEDVNRFTRGHTITHQRVDIVAESLTGLERITAGKVYSGDQATGAGAIGIMAEFHQRVSAGARAMANFFSWVGNTVALNLQGGVVPIFPTATLAGVAGNVTNGFHYVKITFVDAAGGESEGGLASVAVFVVNNAVAGQIALTGVQVGNTDITQRKIYMTLADQPVDSDYFYAGTLADNVTTTYNINVADASLGAIIPATSTTKSLGLLIQKAFNGIATIGTEDNQDVTFIRSLAEKLRLSAAGVVIGSGTAISKHLSATAAWNPPNLAAGAQDATMTIAVAGAALGDTVLVSFSLDLQGMQLTGSVTAANTVGVVLRNGTAGAIDLAAGTLRADVWQH